MSPAQYPMAFSKFLVAPQVVSVGIQVHGKIRFLGEAVDDACGQISRSIVAHDELIRKTSLRREAPLIGRGGMLTAAIQMM